MKIGFLGLGKMGLPVALAIEQDGGHEVLGVDPSPVVAEALSSRELPYRERGSEPYMDATRIQLVDLPALVRHAEVVFVAIQTPHNPRFEGITPLPDDRVDFDYRFLVEGVGALAEEIQRQRKPTIVNVMSTVLPGTMTRHIRPLLNPWVSLSYNPSFIAMGTCIEDFLHPEFVLLGVDDAEAAQTVKRIYASLHDAPVHEVSVESAELCKVAYNTFITSKICIVNTLMQICDAIPGASIDEVTDGLKLANRRLLSPAYMTGGMGDGGGCHPRDNIALSWLARRLDLGYDWFESLMLTREGQARWLATLMIQESRSRGGLPLFVLGRAFKPETNLEAGSPALLVLRLLEQMGHAAGSYDPFSQPDRSAPALPRAVYLIGCRHAQFQEYAFPPGSVLIDPHRYMPDRPGVTVRRIGEAARGATKRADAPTPDAA